MNNDRLNSLNYQLKIYKEKYSALSLEYSTKMKQMEGIIKKEVSLKTKELKEEHKIEISEYKNIIKDKDAQIEALKRELAKKQYLLDNNSYNSGIPTSKTGIGEKKYIPNTRVKTDKNVGGQKGHKKHKLNKFSESEATQIEEVTCDKCPKCNCSDIEILQTSIDKCEIDYDVQLVKKINRFREYKCQKC